MGNDRAYSVLTLKAFDEASGARRFTGIASTPSTDRMDDIVEPRGMTARLPAPLLWQHDKHQPIGWVRIAAANDEGIEVECELAEVKEAGRLKDRLDEAWQSIKAGLVRGLSIGFKPIAAEQIKGSFGMRFKEWELLELSAVTIPANAEASILAIKAADLLCLPRAAPGAVVHLLPGVTGSSLRKGNSVNYQDEIKGWEATRQAKYGAMQALMEKSDGATLDKEQDDEYEALSLEVKNCDKHLKRLADMEKLNVATAKPVEKKEDTTRGTAVEVKEFGPQLKIAHKGDGIAVAQAVRFLALAQGNKRVAYEMAKDGNGFDPRVPEILKANVAAGTTTGATWAAPLVQEGGAIADFVGFLRQQTILGKMEGRMKRIPFRVPVVTQTTGGAGYWVGEGKAKPLTKFDFTRTTLEPLKVANIAVLTKEVIEDSSPAADAMIRDALVDALKERLDIDFITPTKAAVPGISPASITNGVTGIASSGTDAAAIRADIQALWAPFIAARNPATSAVYIMDSTTAMAMSLMQNPLGQSEYPGLNMTGGTLMGIPVIVSDFLPADSGGGMVVLANAADIYFADTGGFQVDMSDQASLEMNDAPAHNSGTPTAAQLVSMFQTNSVAFRAERRLNWMKRRAEAVSFLENVQWGTA